MGELRRELSNGFMPLLACVIGTACGLLAITFYTQGVFFAPVAEEFGWGRAEFFAAFSVMMLTGLVTAPVLGSVLEKYDPKYIGIFGLIGHAIGYALIALNPGSLILWYASFALLAIVSAGSLPITWTTIVNKWFVANRGLAIGFTMGGTGLAATLAPGYSQFLIDSYGWRSAYLYLGLTALAIALPVVIVCLKKEDPTGTAVASVAARQQSQWGYTRSEALSSYRFWALGAALVLITMALAGFAPNFIPFLMDSGLMANEAASVVGLMGFSVIVGRLGSGFLIDRIWAPGVAAVAFSLPAVGMFIFTAVDVNYTIAAMIAVFVGLSLGAELDIMAYLTSRYFGVTHYGSIFGAIYVFFTLGAGSAGVLWGVLRDINNSYTFALYLGGGGLCIAIALILSMGDYPEKRQTLQASFETA